VSVEHGAPIGFFSDREELALVERELGLKQKKKRKDPEDYEIEFTHVKVDGKWVPIKKWEKEQEERAKAFVAEFKRREKEAEWRSMLPEKRGYVSRRMERRPRK
jgi:hypothetical protein